MKYLGKFILLGTLLCPGLLGISPSAFGQVDNRSTPPKRQATNKPVPSTADSSPTGEKWKITFDNSGNVTASSVEGTTVALTGNESLTFEGTTLTFNSSGTTLIPVTINVGAGGWVQKWTTNPADPAVLQAAQPVYWYFKTRMFNGTVDDVFGFRYNPDKNPNRPWLQWSFEGDYNTGTVDANNNPVHLFEHNWDYEFNGQHRRPFAFNINPSNHQSEFGINGRILHTLVDYPSSGIFYNYNLGSGGSHDYITGWDESGDYSTGIFHRWTNTNTNAGTLSFGYYTQGAGSISFKYGRDAGANQFEHTINIINADQSYRHYAPGYRLTQLIDARGNFLVGNGSALNANATDGFLYVPRINGTPSGSPPNYGYAVPLVFQEGVQDKLWIRRTDGTWVSTTFGNTSPVTSMIEASSNQLVNTSAAESAVNYIKVDKAAAGNAAAISADGETNASIIIDAKGTGVIKFNHATVESPVFLTDDLTIATDASRSNYFRVTLTGDRMLGNPANPTDGQVAIWEIAQDGMGGHTLSYGNKFTYGAEVNQATVSLGAYTHSFITARYNSVSDKWYVISVLTGY